MAIEDEILAMVRRWLPFGGPPPAEVWLEFGMNSTKFYALAQEIVDRGSPPVTAQERNLIAAAGKSTKGRKRPPS